MEQLLTIDEVATTLQLHHETVKFYIQTGKLKAIKIGYRTTRIAKADLDEFIKCRRGDNYFNE